LFVCKKKQEMNGLKQVEANKEAIILCSLKLRVCYNRVCYNQVLRYFSTNCKNRAKNKLVQIMKIELTKKLIFLLSQLSLVVSSVNTNQGQDQFCLDMSITNFDTVDSFLTKIKSLNHISTLNLDVSLGLESRILSQQSIPI
jgi:hypothetical protein